MPKQAVFVKQYYPQKWPFLKSVTLVFYLDLGQMTLIRCSSVTCTHIPNMSFVAWLVLE